eukprot:SAG11_NODE_40145_length_209_cov_30.427273_1_plen_25_part_01
MDTSLLPRRLAAPLLLLLVVCVSLG